MAEGKILIADDDIELLEMLTIQLKAAGYEVMRARDGYQAVAYARRFEPDLIILDVNMPAGDGFSVQERLAKMSDLSGVPVLYLTGDRSERVKIGCAAYRALGVIHKPFEIDDLLKQVASALRRPAGSSERAA